ncbi:TetR/AcrR family transcriptional regulator [Leifsonia poae]|uniref:TetR/AcrR family transcriptional regulator n=1 Tax=Leifsonia poae TaxID=110933 RepID=UPI001CBC175C|nr:TetR/AcrR family transcriptional regulator [Leifsonia poae]
MTDLTNGLRVDAQRNRQRLLEVARRAFATDSKPSLESIARDAGVGIGTLYRNFPTRDALVEAIYRTELDHLSGQAAELLALHAPDVALRAWMDRFADYAVAKRELADALRSMTAPGAITHTTSRDQLAGAVRPLLAAGAESGVLRADVDGLDVVASLVGIFLVAADPAQATRMLDLLMDGLRTVPAASDAR